MDKKKIVILIILGIFLCFSAAIYFNSKKVNENTVNVYIFRGEGCPHCAAEMKYLNTLKDVYKDNINIIDYEVWYNQENAEKLNKVSEKIGINIDGVPFTIIGDKYFSGYSEGLNDEIKKIIEDNIHNDIPQIMDSIK